MFQEMILYQIYIIATVCMFVCMTPILRNVKRIILQYRIQRGTWPVNVPGDWRRISLKPFDCSLCLTFWVSLAINCYLFSIPEAIGISCINALVASQLEKYLKK